MDFLVLSMYKTELSNIVTISYTPIAFSCIHLFVFGAQDAIS